MEWKPKTSFNLDDIFSSSEEEEDDEEETELESGISIPHKTASVTAAVNSIADQKTIDTLSVPQDGSFGFTALSFVHYFGKPIKYDPEQHKVLFWEWHRGKIGTLAFVDKISEWARQNSSGSFWVAGLNDFARIHPHGTKVPLLIQKRFLGMPDFHQPVVSACYPGIDAVIFHGDREEVKSILKRYSSNNSSRMLLHSFTVLQDGPKVKFVVARKKGTGMHQYGWIANRTDSETNTKSLPLPKLKHEEWKDSSALGPNYQKHFGSPVDWTRKRMIQPGAMADDSSDSEGASSLYTADESDVESASSAAIPIARLLSSVVAAPRLEPRKPISPLIISTLSVPQDYSLGFLKLSFHHYFDHDEEYDPRLHRVLFWTWHKNRIGTLSFVDKIGEWSALGDIVEGTRTFWLALLNRFALDNPQGTPVPLCVMKRFLGLPNFDKTACEYSQCIPGLDPRI